MNITIDGIEYDLQPVDPDAPNWEVQLNGKVITDRVQTLALINRAMGIGYLYGMNPGAPMKDPSDPNNAKRRYGMAQGVNRGGPVIVPTLEFEGRLYFLALRQGRPLVSPEKILEFPRGQAKANENAIASAQRELIEETGLPVSIDDLIYLGRGNPDTALFHGANVHCWWLRLPQEYFVVTNGKPSLRPGFEGDNESKFIENIKEAEVVAEGDMHSLGIFTMWAMGLVLQRLRQMEQGISVNAGGVIPPYSHG